MAYLADLHVHSHFSRATSDSCRAVPLAQAAARKGLTVVGTGDFTHAGWRAELGAELAEAEEGFYRLRTDEGPAAQVRFVVTGEISCIYKQGGRTRKIHHLVLLPNLNAAARVSAALEARGENLEPAFRRYSMAHRDYRPHLSSRIHRRWPPNAVTLFCAL